MMNRLFRISGIVLFFFGGGLLYAGRYWLDEGVVWNSSLYYVFWLLPLIGLVVVMESGKFGRLTTWSARERRPRLR